MAVEAVYKPAVAVGQAGTWFGGHPGLRRAWICVVLGVDRKWCL